VSLWSHLKEIMVPEPVREARYYAFRYMTFNSEGLCKSTRWGRLATTTFNFPFEIVEAYAKSHDENIVVIDYVVSDELSDYWARLHNPDYYVLDVRHTGAKDFYLIKVLRDGRPDEVLFRWKPYAQKLFRFTLDAKLTGGGVPYWGAASIPRRRGDPAVVQKLINETTGFNHTDFVEIGQLQSIRTQTKERYGIPEIGDKLVVIYVGDQKPTLARPFHCRKYAETIVGSRRCLYVPLGLGHWSYFL
jgi:hypothetical protein